MFLLGLAIGTAIGFSLACAILLSYAAGKNTGMKERR